MDPRLPSLIVIVVWARLEYWPVMPSQNDVNHQASEPDPSFAISMDVTNDAQAIQSVPTGRKIPI